MKTSIIFLIFSVTFLFASETQDLEKVKQKIEYQNNGFMKGNMTTSMEDDWLKITNYYINGESFKNRLKEPDRSESI